MVTPNKKQQRYQGNQIFIIFGNPDSYCHSIFNMKKGALILFNNKLIQ